MAQHGLMGSFKVFFEENHGGFIVMSWDLGLNGGFMVVLLVISYDGNLDISYDGISYYIFLIYVVSSPS